MGIREEIISVVKEAFGIAPKEESLEFESLKFIKDKDGNYSKWLGIYSNSFRDDDWVPEILESEGHIDFVKGVDAGIYALPELWVWHEPKWKIGVAKFVAVDIVAPGIVFAIAGGIIDETHYGIAKAIAESDVEWRMSHTFITNDRNKNDNSYRKWVTLEVSILPAGKEANPLTKFGLLEQSEEQMIDSKKRDEMKAFGMTDAQLDSLEASNKNMAESAVPDRQFKEKGDDGLIGGGITAEDVEGEKSIEETVVEQAEDVAELVAEEDSVEEEVIEEDEESVDTPAINGSENVMAQFVDLFKAMDERLDKMQQAIDETRAAAENKAQHAEDSMSPVASYAGLNSLLSKYANRSNAAELDENDGADAELLKQKPEEAKAKSEQKSKFNSSVLTKYIQANAQ